MEILEIKKAITKLIVTVKEEEGVFKDTLSFSELLPFTETGTEEEIVIDSKKIVEKYYQNN